jgi:uncharacterized protein YneF (UPF0154 family)
MNLTEILVIVGGLAAGWFVVAKLMTDSSKDMRDESNKSDHDFR